jgi:penicillin-binding protein 2
MVSYPTYDVNRYDELYKAMADDEIDEPLRNRATESQLEPGSTVKPLVGLAAITQGVIGVNKGVECTGYLVLDDHHGHPVRFGTLGRCWVASMYEKLLNGNVAHHQVPFPHRGHDGNLDGFLTYSDALERSCNVYFETVADRLGIDALTDWMERFGLGHKTGIGIEEYAGYVPAHDTRKNSNRRSTGFFGGIGQGYIAATPIQMANIAATIAREGMWMRPQLVMAHDGHMPALHPLKLERPDTVDLHLDPAAIKACHLGMYNVVNSPGGTGKAAHMTDVVVAAKTGTAQAAKFRSLKRDAQGNPVVDEKGRKQYEEYEASTPGHPNGRMPWYRGTAEGRIDHSWMIGYAPANDPQVAFGVLVEYGGSGGGAAADVVKAALEACIAHEHLVLPPKTAQSQVGEDGQ